MTFEEALPIIDKCLSLRRHKWTLAAISWMDYDDVCQHVRFHIWKKWHLFNPEKGPLPNWINTIISHKLTNITREVYGNASRPCLRCAADEGLENGVGLCSIYGTQCNSCPFYAEWERKKKPSLDIKLPVTIEHHSQEVFNLPHDGIDVEKTIRSISEKMPHVLKPNELKVYYFLYVDGLSEEQTARKLGYKNSEKGKQEGYRVVTNLRKIIINKIKEAIKNDEIEI